MQHDFIKSEKVALNLEYKQFACFPKREIQRKWLDFACNELGMS